MHPGEIVDARFELEAFAAEGGMGAVYRARDRTSGELVAVKVLLKSAMDVADRFAREIRVLAQLRHPGIVRYIADGRTPAGEPWMAMEWLEGESLAERLARSGLTAHESVELARRISEALGAAHERGVVHRDVKPANIMLVGNDLERVKVLDFGVARVATAQQAHGATRTGIMIGTPGYMAPEQVRGEKDVGARADVFAVGCVLFECLTGRPVFVGEHAMALLAKILLEDAPRVNELRPVPDALDDLVARTLCRQPDQRPRDGLALAAQLATVDSLDATERAATHVGPSALTATERRLLCVVVIGPDEAPASGKNRPTPTVVDDVSRTITLDLPPETLDTLGTTARQHGGHLARLADGSFVVTLASTGGASDQVMQAARCALALKAVAPIPPIALATGRGVMAGRWPVGEAIDRAVRMLDARTPFVRIDGVTAGLLDARFDVGGDAQGLYLVGERDPIEVTRTLMGRSTPCVGRDRELAVLTGLYDECVNEPIARAVLVTGAPGVGKSRLRFELVNRVRARGEPVEVWIGRGDPMRAGSPFGLIAPALRRACGIHEGETLETRQHKLRARVHRNATRAGNTLHRTTLFLGELIGAPFADDDPVLRAARQDPLLMSDQVRRAFEHVLAIETSVQPVVIVLEDLHWGDLPSTKLIEGALRTLPDRAWFVIALARPDVHELFPRMWAERGVHELRVDELTRKSARAARPPRARRRRGRHARRAHPRSGGRQRVLSRGVGPRGRRGQG